MSPPIACMSRSPNRDTTMRLRKTNIKTASFTPKIELETEDHDEKSLYICSTEIQQDYTSSAFVIRTVQLSDLLSSSSSSPVTLRKVADYTPGYPLPESVGCGVLGSRIFFTGGLTYDDTEGRRIPVKGVYTFDTNVPTNKSITKLDANLRGAKVKGSLMTELCGKLYALPCWVFKNAASFEVFDPKLGSWGCSPQPPLFTPGSPYYVDDLLSNLCNSYLVAGTKIFVSNQECPVFCFDAAHPEREWRKVSTMCYGGSFPFRNTALVIDIPNKDDRKIVFAYTYNPWCLQVYLMSLCDNQETITEIGQFHIPVVSGQFGSPKSVKLIHIEDNKACLAVTQFLHPLQYDTPEPVTKKHYGVVIPFRYELDMTKDDNNCLTLDFEPDCCCFEYDTDPCYRDQIQSAGCFLL